MSRCACARMCVCLNDCFAFLDTNHLLRHLVMKRTVWCTGKCHLHCLPLITALSWLMANVCLAPPLAAALSLRAAPRICVASPHPTASLLPGCPTHPCN